MCCVVLCYDECFVLCNVCVELPEHNDHRGLRQGDEHESLPDHQGREDDHGQVQTLERQVALVFPQLLQFHLLAVINE